MSQREVTVLESHHKEKSLYLDDVRPLLEQLIVYCCRGGPAAQACKHSPSRFDYHSLKLKETPVMPSRTNSSNAASSARTTDVAATRMVQRFLDVETLTVRTFSM